MATDYQGNSKKSKENKPEPPPKVVERIVTTEVIQKKKGPVIKFKEIFFGGTAKDAARYVFADVTLPALRYMVFDMGTEGLRRIIFGVSALDRRRPGTGVYQTQGYYDYSTNLLRQMVNQPRPMVNLPDQRMRPDPRTLSDPRAINAPGRARANDTVLVIQSRAEAEAVVERLIDIIDKYDVASVQDLNEMLGLPVQPIDNKWGWSALNTVNIRQVGGGYMIDLPPPESL